MSTCTIAEGKIKVAFNKGVNVADGCILDGEGNATNDPKAFYAAPPGAILPVAGHKGYGLSVIAEVLALSGGPDRRLCAGHFGVDRVSQQHAERLASTSSFPGTGRPTASRRRSVEFITHVGRARGR